MKIKNILGATAIAIAGALVSMPALAVDCPTGSIHEADGADTLAGCNIDKDNSLMPTIKTIIEVIIGVLGIVAVAVIVLGGVSYTTSAGEPGKVKKAKDTILYGKYDESLVCKTRDNIVIPTKEGIINSLNISKVNITDTTENNSKTYANNFIAEYDLATDTYSITGYDGNYPSDLVLPDKKDISFFISISLSL